MRCVLRQERQLWLPLVLVLLLSAAAQVRVAFLRDVPVTVAQPDGTLLHLLARQSCTITAPQAGTWHLGLQAYEPFSGVTVSTTTVVGEPVHGRFRH